MKDHEKILEMIENVDPSDTDTLDEIDKFVWHYYMHRGNEDDEFFKGLPHPKFTRSRDALKSIRPNGYTFEIGRDRLEGDCLFYVANLYKGFGIPSFRLVWKNKDGLTEELAELHVIIQSIAHERENND